MVSEARLLSSTNAKRDLCKGGFCSPCVSVRHQGAQISDKLWPSTRHLISPLLLLPIISSSKECKGFTLSHTVFCWRDSTKLWSCCPILKKWVWRFYFNCICSFSFIQIITLTGDYLSGSSQCVFFFMLFLHEKEQRSQHHWWVIHLTSKSELWQ